MKLIKIDQEQWAKGLEAAGGTYNLFGPIKEKDYYSFKPLPKGQLPDVAFFNTRLSAKTILFPQSENILQYNLDESADDHHIMKEVVKNESSRAILGIRPCDAKAVTLLNLNFVTDEYTDPYWQRTLNATTLIGLACDDPATTCFCTTAGCGPYHEEGLDILLVADGEDYVAKVLTEKGQQFAAAADWTAESNQQAILKERRKAAEAKIVSKIDSTNLRDSEILDLHGAEFWDDVSFACLNCGTCTFACPTCWCFDIQDEVAGKRGVRMKNWDSCMFPIFTVHTTGHNPRDTKLKRVRQRFMHKLKYFVDKYEKGIMCVGCGRCVRQCPVNIDIRRVCDLMNNYKPADACAAQES
jgi:ferredoxin